jgi:hypothetical protein
MPATPRMRLGKPCRYRQTKVVEGWSGRVKRMRESRPALFRGRHFRSEVIVLCVRWNLRYPLSHRDLEEMMAGLVR